MLKFNEYLDNELADDDFLLEIEEDLEEDAITLEDLIEWAEQLTEDQITEDLLDEKETQAAGSGKFHSAIGESAQGGHAAHRGPQEHDELG